MALSMGSGTVFGESRGEHSKLEEQTWFQPQGGKAASPLQTAARASDSCLMFYGVRDCDESHARASGKDQKQSHLTRVLFAALQLEPCPGPRHSLSFCLWASAHPEFTGTGEGLPQEMGFMARPLSCAFVSHSSCLMAGVLRPGLCQVLPCGGCVGLTCH